MNNLKYYYAKLSCPKSNDENHFLQLFENLKKNKLFDLNLKNIPNNLDKAKPKDIIFIHIGGDHSNKKKYFKEKHDFNNYENGLHCIGIINDIELNKKEIQVSIIGLKSIVTKEDLYFFPQFINNLGAATKGTPNQAGLYELDEDVALGLIEYIFKRELIDKNNKLFKELNVNDTLFSGALNEYNNNFKEKKLTQTVFQKYTNKIDKQGFDNKLVDEFIKWFNSSENFKNSYKGIVNKENLTFWDKVYFNNNLFKITGKEKKSSFEKLKKLIIDNKNDDWIEFNKSSSKGAPKAVLGDKNYLKFLDTYLNNYSFNQEIELLNFKISKFDEDCTVSNLKYSNQLITRYISSLVTKPFVLLSGLSGSGKTKLAQSFAQWICEDKTQYCIVPVGADWTNREPLLGYVNALDNKEYILPENGALQLLIRANKNQEKPYFLILDEMNLSHVERYFSDFLSVMESKDKFKLHSSESNLNITDGDKFEKSIEVPNVLDWPKNLFVVGTVNIDETTYMFSPKVLDRANVIEFRINETEMGSYLTEAKDVTDLNGEGKSMGESFVTIATEKAKANSDTLKTTLNNFFSTLQEVGAEFGYRTASEIQTLFGQIDLVNPDFSEKENEKIDIAIMQKLLPKLHGSRSKLTPILKTLATLCYQDNKDFTLEQKDKVFEMVKEDTKIVQYPISLEKITRMYHNVIANGFTSYAEA